MFMMRFDMRAPDGGAPPADLYRAALDMAEWGENNGCIAIAVSESPGVVQPAAPSTRTPRKATRLSTLPVMKHSLTLTFCRRSLSSPRANRGAASVPTEIGLFSSP